VAGHTVSVWRSRTGPQKAEARQRAAGICGLGLGSSGPGVRCAARAGLCSGTPTATSMSWSAGATAARFPASRFGERGGSGPVSLMR